MTFDDNLADERLSVPQPAAHRDEGGRLEPVLKKIREVHLLNAVRLTDVRLQVGILLAVITFVTACAPSNTSATPPAASAATAGTGANSAATASTPAAPAAATMTMTDALRFEPATLTVAKGATVTWRNTSATMHTVTDDPGKAVTKADATLPSGAQPWDSGNIDPGQTFQHTFDTPGTYKYFCTPHEAAGMVATITVTG
jgi:plastocyanin